MTIAVNVCNGILQNCIEWNLTCRVNLTEICGAGGTTGTPCRDKSYTYYMNKPKRDNDPIGAGPFLGTNRVSEGEVVFKI